MPIIVDHQGIRGDLQSDIARLDKLVTDLKRIAEGKTPSAQLLEGSPYLRNWQLASYSVPRLVGECDNHPILSAQVIRTSDIWVFAPELGWARTLSRFYRLGKPADEEG